ncbi:MAG: hypothetical protein KME29_39390 [Calothrix sp. FI2-JRJ7]|nr:hypothetical protein [Calothrix sp. FI2-JRJ7]
MNPKLILDLPINFINTNVHTQRMEKEWRTWNDSGLKRFSPNLAPFLRQPTQLKQVVTQNVSFFHPKPQRYWVFTVEGTGATCDCATCSKSFYNILITCEQQ